MSTHEFTIPVHDLDAAGKPFVFAIRPEWLRGALEVEDGGPDGSEPRASDVPGKLEVRASKSGTDVVVHGHLTATVEVPCARCLAPTQVTIDQPLTALMVPRSQVKTPESEEYEFSADEADVLPYDGDILVLDDLVRDEILLEIPMIPLCSEDCPGISPPPAPAPRAGSEPENATADRPIDPRLAPLLKLSLSTGSPKRTPKETKE